MQVCSSTCNYCEYAQAPVTSAAVPCAKQVYTVCLLSISMYHRCHSSMYYMYHTSMYHASMYHVPCYYVPCALRLRTMCHASIYHMPLEHVPCHASMYHVRQELVPCAMRVCGMCHASTYHVPYEYVPCVNRVCTMSHAYVPCEISVCATGNLGIGRRRRLRLAPFDTTARDYPHIARVHCRTEVGRPSGVTDIRCPRTLNTVVEILCANPAENM